MSQPMKMTTGLPDGGEATGLTPVSMRVYVDMDAPDEADEERYEVPVHVHFDDGEIVPGAFPEHYSGTWRQGEWTWAHSMVMTAMRTVRDYLAERGYGQLEVELYPGRSDKEDIDERE